MTKNQPSLLKLDISKTVSVLSNVKTRRDHLEKKYSNKIVENLSIGRLVSYQGNKKLPILRLYRYKEAFSYQFIAEIFKQYDINDKDYVFDPFCGMGTTLFTSCVNGISSVGIDRMPTGAFISSTLPKILLLKSGELKQKFNNILNQFKNADESNVAEDVQIMKKAFSKESLSALKKWKTVISNSSSPYKEVIKLLYLSIIEDCSFTSKDGQFLRHLPNKKVFHPTDLLIQKVDNLENDLLKINQLGWDKNYAASKVIQADTRDLTSISFERKPSFIITSPPYANRYDYTRSYSLELCLNFVENFEELKKLRFGILRSHIEAKAEENDSPPHSAVTEILSCIEKKADEEKLNNPRIPIMILAYFVDMHKVIKQWSQICEKNARVIMVVDNVRFVGEHIPVDLILSDLAEQEGFKVEKICVARYKGNSSQQMGRYGRFPVRESIVVWRKI